MEARTVELQISGMSCQHCVAAVERALRDTTGVSEAAVSLADERGTVHYDDEVTTPEALLEVVREAGYEATAL